MSAALQDIYNFAQDIARNRMPLTLRQVWMLQLMDKEVMNCLDDAIQKAIEAALEEGEEDVAQELRNILLRKASAG